MLLIVLEAKISQKAHETRAIANLTGVMRNRKARKARKARKTPPQALTEPHKPSRTGAHSAPTAPKQLKFTEPGTIGECIARLAAGNPAAMWRVCSSNVWGGSTQCT